MIIESEIKEYNPTSGAILVKYFCAEYLEGLTYWIDLPIENNSLPSEEVTNNLVALNVPRIQLERYVALPTATVPQYLLDKIPAQVVTPVAPV